MRIRRIVYCPSVSATGTTWYLPSVGMRRIRIVRAYINVGAS